MGVRVHATPVVLKQVEADNTHLSLVSREYVMGYMIPR